METANPDPKKEGDVRQAVHGLFVKVQQKTGLKDEKIDEFQKKWLDTPEVRTKYSHWWDATAIGGEELYAMFNDIIDFVQDQEGGKSHVFASLRKEADQILKDPEAYVRHLTELGRGWMQRGMGVARGWMGNRTSVGKAPVPKATQEPPKALPPEPIREAEKEVVVAKEPEAETEEPLPEEEAGKEAEETEESWFGGGGEEGEKEGAEEKEEEEEKPETEEEKPKKRAKAATSKKTVAKKPASKKTKK